MNLESTLCPGDVLDVHEFAALLLPYFDILAARSDNNAASGNIQTNEKLNYEEVFGNEVKSLDEILTEMQDLLRNILESDRTVIWLLDYVTNKLVMHNPKDMCCSQPTEQEVEVGTIIPAYVVKRKQHVMLSGTINDDCRFPLGNEDNNTKAILCVPILKPDEEIAGAIECYRFTENEYDANDLHTLMTLMIWIGAIIDQQIKRDKLQEVQNMNNMYMKFVHDFFTQDVDLEKLLYKIFDCTKSMVSADRGYIALITNVDNPLEVDIYDEIPSKQIMKMKFYTLDPERGCASICIRNRQTVNIVNPERKLYDLELDRYIGTTTNSILCLPIMDKTNILGCIQLFNKKNGNFDETDEYEIGRILVYYSLLLHGMLVRKKISHNNDYNNVMHEMLSYEMNKMIKESHIDENIQIPENFESYSFNSTDPSLLPSYCYYIFKSLIDPEFFDSIKYNNFVLIVHRNYRTNPFHNFDVMFMSFHCVYVMLRANINNFDPIEVIAMLITSFCIKIDHRGLTNSYYAATKHPMHTLYNGHSCWQNHCLWLTRQIIKRVRLFDDLIESHVKQIDEILENGFLALDFSAGLKSINKLYPIVKNKAFHWNTTGHRSLIHILIVFAAEIVIYTKGYDIARQAIENLAKEHFNEGQLLKDKGFLTTLIVDRSRKHEILEKEVTFINTITLPVFELCTILLDNCDELLTRSVGLLKIVEDIVSTRGQKVWYPDGNFGKFEI